MRDDVLSAYPGLDPGRVRVVYNGPGEPAWTHAGAMASNGQRAIRLSRLAILDRQVDPSQRLVQHEAAPI